MSGLYFVLVGMLMLMLFGLYFESAMNAYLNKKLLSYMRSFYSQGHENVRRVGSAAVAIDPERIYVLDVDADHVKSYVHKDCELKLESSKSGSCHVLTLDKGNPKENERIILSQKVLSSDRFEKEYQKDLVEFIAILRRVRGDG